MGSQIIHALGRQEKVFVTPETTWGTFVAPASADAVKVLSTSMVADQERVIRDDKNATTRSPLERISRRKSFSWTIETYLCPSGVAGTPPDIGFLLAAVFGKEDVAAGVSVTYSLEAFQEKFQSDRALPGTFVDYYGLQITREVSKQMMEVMQGGWVEDVTFDFSGGDEVKVSFSGGAKSKITTFRSSDVTTAAASATIQFNTADHYKRVEVNSMVQILDTDGTVLDDNGGSGYKVTSVDTALNRCDVTPVVTGLNANKVLAPFTPSETTAGSPAPAIIGSCTIDSTACPLTSVSMSITNNVKEINDEYGEDGPSDYLMMKREVAATLGLRMQDNLAEYFIEGADFTTEDIDVIAGATASGGNRATFSMPYAEPNPSEISVPSVEESTFDHEVIALGSSGEDEIALVID